MKILYSWHQFLYIRIINKKIIHLTQRFCNTAFAEIMGNTEGKMGNATVGENGEVLGKKKSEKKPVRNYLSRPLLRCYCPDVVTHW